MAQATAVVEKLMTEAELKAQMDKAYKAGDWKQIARVAGEIAKFEKDKEAREHAAVLKALEAVTEEVKKAIDKALRPLIDAKKLDKADGIWYANDFGEKLATCRLTKSAPRKASTDGKGGGKKFDVSTDDLLAKFGGEVYKDGVTFKAAFEKDTDKNKRYAIREALLKKGGYIK